MEVHFIPRPSPNPGDPSRNRLADHDGGLQLDPYRDPQWNQNRSGRPALLDVASACIDCACLDDVTARADEGELVDEIDDGADVVGYH